MLLALAYACVALYMAKSVDRSAFQFMKEFVLALFFIMWFVGQFLRTSKELDDKGKFTALQSTLSEVKEAISGLEKFKVPEDKNLSYLARNALLHDAAKAVASGHVLAGLMQAGVAYEQALLAAARRHQIQHDRRTIVSRIIRDMREYYDEATIAELNALWQLRHRLIHLTEEAALELEKQPGLIKYFEWAINVLEQQQQHPQSNS